MRLLALLALVVLSGCGLFQPRPVQIDPTPELLALRAELEAGRLGQAEFERRVSAALGATVTEIKADWSGMAASVASDVSAAMLAETQKNPPPASPVGLILWGLGVLGVGGAAATANLALKQKKISEQIAAKPAVAGGAT